MHAWSRLILFQQVTMRMCVHVHVSYACTCLCVRVNVLMRNVFQCMFMCARVHSGNVCTYMGIVNYLIFKYAP